MFKVYKKADILEKISDRVKMVDDLYHLPPDLFDRELFDYWYSVYLDDYQDRGYDDFDFDLRDIRLFYYAFYLMECRGCCNLVLIEFGDMILPVLLLSKVSSEMNVKNFFARYLT